MDEFKGTRRAQEYAKNKSTSEVFKETHYLDFLCGYNQALHDTKAPEMLQLLKSIFNLQREYYGNGSKTHIELIDKAKEIEQLIKQVTEL